MMQKTLSLLELNQHIAQTLDAQLEPTYWIVAEIGEFRDSAKGHVYLDLVEKADRQVLAKMRANIWSYTYRGIASRFFSITGQGIRQGMKILAQVNVQFHEVYGISLVVKDIDPNYTIGERARKKQEVIEKLTAEGLLEMNKQFPLSMVPQKVAVISSASAAGYGDFVNQLEQNVFGFKVNWRLYPAAMQGDDAVDSIIRAIEQVEADHQTKPFDLLVIIRGGGAQIDMDCFDDYDLSRAIALSILPVVTGIGHERDESVADLVAHTRMKTPTAVAEFILSGFRDFESELEFLHRRLEKITHQIIQVEQSFIQDKESFVKNFFRIKLNQAHQMIDNYQHQVRGMAKTNLRWKENQLVQLGKIGIKNWRHLLLVERNRLENLTKSIKDLDPETILERGYTRTEFDGKSIHLQTPRVGGEMVTFTKSHVINSEIKIISKK
ncbi:exodeoxyribonuclease VII large subunit [Pararhodonellum marinum]|uniref:exodeoxyribonuclease VII large subunit n=1 Tax=Pararhodonellum marinum TaxID=2755358 RepID=UPI001E5ACE8F|nr:exodeoxyribonuclease VII large subunit [Pararhodonellum marinum]